MAKPQVRATPDNRVERWKKLWGTPRPVADDAVQEAFDEFREAFVPGHMHKRFLQTFGVPKASFGNRFFKDEAIFRPLTTRFSSVLAPGVTHVEAIVIYASPDSLEAYALRGESRRSLADLFIDDWHAACAIVRGGDTTIYTFIEPKMKGAIVRTVRGANETAETLPEDEEPGTFVEPEV